MLNLKFSKHSEKATVIISLSISKGFEDNIIQGIMKINEKNYIKQRFETKL